MKKLLVSLFLICSCNVFSQLAPPTPKINLNLPNIYSIERQPKSGPYIMLGGIAFAAAGILTSPNMVGGSTTQQKPFYTQARSLTVFTGALVFGTGVIFTIQGK